MRRDARGITNSVVDHDEEFALSPCRAPRLYSLLSRLF